MAGNLGFQFLVTQCTLPSVHQQVPCLLAMSTSDQLQTWNLRDHLKTVCEGVHCSAEDRALTCKIPSKEGGHPKEIHRGEKCPP